MTAETIRVALVGNPNCGKTALFNQLTGARQKVANYAGVTVERKEGQCVMASGRVLNIIDLPGTYSFDALNLGERVTCDVLAGNYHGEARPDVIVCVADATNLRLNLRFVLELKRLGYPLVLALNMMDAARRRGMSIDISELSHRLGLPVIETVAVKRRGVQALINCLDGELPVATRVTPEDVALETEIHAQVRELLAATVTMPQVFSKLDDSLDRWILHPVFGLVILMLVMFLMFQAVYALGVPLSDAIGDGFDWLGNWFGNFLPPGPLQGLVVQGLCAGLGTVLGFLPEVLLLFFFLLVLEQSGYLPRAAFLLDRAMRSVGLAGHSLIPLLSSFACAIPGIMGTRGISDSRERLATMLVAPLMTCSARLPVYTLLIAAFIPAGHMLSVFNMQGIVLFVLYFAGIAGAMLVAWVMKRINRDKSEHVLLMELPSYRLPTVSDVGIGLYKRCTIFLRRLTGLVMALTVLMWVLVSYPSPPVGATGPAIDYSFAGHIGQILSHLFAPLGFNWQMTLALVPAFAAREVAVSALATVYAVANESGLGHTLAMHISLPAALSMLAWFVYAPQCMSTLVVIRRESGYWRYAAYWFGYSFTMAYVASLVTYQIASVFL